MSWPRDLILLSVLCQATPVYAYQNPERFAVDVEQGGGGGRYFTGAPVDAYTCGVCHASPERSAVQVLGLPENEYEPGATYRIIVDWPDELSNVALNMEMSDLAGNPLGQWFAPDPATLPLPDHCTNPLSDTPTGTHVVLDAKRMVVAMSECGQHQLSVDWQAPVLPYDAWFSGSLIAANHDGKLSGDHAADFSRLLVVPRTADVPITNVLVSCSVTQPGHDRSGWFVGALFVAWLACRHTLRTRRGRPLAQNAHDR
ncbi:MAG: hypothetical protein RL701_6222 [Pseudomonadota bacterium]